LTVTPTYRPVSDTFAEVRLETKIVTPYNSSFNHLRIYFRSKQPAADIRVKIFNLHNALINEITVQDHGEYYLAEWDCRDRNNRIKQGIYIYQIEAEGKAYNGAFVVAK
jgi:hypothetical protein